MIRTLLEQGIRLVLHKVGIEWFVHGFAQNLAEEMREWSGRCTVIAPGMVNTPFFDEPKPDKLDPQDVADAVLHALNAHPRNCVREVFLMPGY